MSIEVVGCVPGRLCLPAIGPYEASLLDPPLGKKGIVVIGATNQEQIDIPPDGTFQGTAQTVGAGSSASE